MARLVAEMTMSLDGFIALPDDSVNGLFDWYSNGPVEVPTARPDMTWHVTEASAEHLRRTMSTAGACWWAAGSSTSPTAGTGSTPSTAPSWCSAIPFRTAGPARAVPYTFVTTGFADAVKAATALAGGQDVGLAGPMSSGRPSTPGSWRRSA